VRCGYLRRRGYESVEVVRLGRALEREGRLKIDNVKPVSDDLPSHVVASANGEGNLGDAGGDVYWKDIRAGGRQNKCRRSGSEDDRPDLVFDLTIPFRQVGLPQRK
jgi:hypothetical protein